MSGRQRYGVYGNGADFDYDDRERQKAKDRAWRARFLASIHQDYIEQRAAARRRELQLLGIILCALGLLLLAIGACDLLLALKAR
jgi:hypothetical protein